tara:strand:+ start:290 stop:745 length:456 start_codon:yes stop_codon:yes gene_type:complete
MTKKIDYISGTESAYTMTEQEELAYEEEKAGVYDEEDFYQYEAMQKQERKQMPVFSGVLKYFPDAIREVAKTSWIGNQQHHPDKPLHWDRTKSGDELDALTRHLMEAGEIDTDLIRHSAKVAWRALANLQKELEENGEAPLSDYNLNKEKW